MGPGSNIESYPAFAHIGLRENPGKNLNQDYDQQRADQSDQVRWLHVTDAESIMARHVFPRYRQWVKNYTQNQSRTHRHDTTVHDVIRLLIPALYKNQSDSLMAADGDCHHLCKLMKSVRHRWNISDAIGEIRNTVMPSDCSALRFGIRWYTDLMTGERCVVRWIVLSKFHEGIPKRGAWSLRGKRRDLLGRTRGKNAIYQMGTHSDTVGSKNWLEKQWATENQMRGRVQVAARRTVDQNKTPKNTVQGRTQSINFERQQQPVLV
ncbi:hypothetical protein ANN_23664 [Periplaneta americana]|uniref:Uncharacterized protein n=1 Tax=Periplaneta americana TaxID=6978 RepID=A0ABQ8SLP8_PERAM|nr:hypothetical protein ANN_23664 [Periplaneta americana]